MISANQVRKQFIEFFKSKEHKFVRSSPVYPMDDQTLLFTNAGMNQFKPIFLDQEIAKNKRVTNSQKCIRASGKHNDLEEVGVDNYHHTFFEMLGNWSFGDFYKEEAIIWAWELLTETWKLDKDRIWVTIYKDDNETGKIWKNSTDIDSTRILKFGNKENFWEMGDVGPCGPCTEIHYFTGKNINEQDKNGVNQLPEYREIWNIVFIQYNRTNDGKLSNLPSKHVDTGAGLERITAILNGYESNYDTDLFRSIIDEIINVSGKKYSYENGIPHRVISDHLRMVGFSIADGIMPSNEGRGYVVRRILRRALRYGRKIGLDKPFLHDLFDVLKNQMGNYYPELNEKSKHIKKVILSEEISFNRTLDKGLEIFDNICKSLNNSTVITGFDAFKLYDTFGFPIDLTQLLAKERNLTVDIDSFKSSMDKQKQMARKSRVFNNQDDKVNWINLNNSSKSVFLGYLENKSKSSITKYRITESIVEIVLDKTPFYAESGGQVGDKGIIYNSDFEFAVNDTQQIGDDIIHYGQFISGSLKKSYSVEAKIDNVLRQKTKINHTATHLLHKSLKNNLGDHIQQAGSLVSPYKLRFDLTHFEKITQKEIDEIELQVNEVILRNTPLSIKEMTYDNAKKCGAEALFGEKYGDIVRVVDVADYSTELCGGTHVDATGEIGLFKIISESSLASGVRRIEAVTGKEAYCHVIKYEKKLHDIIRLLNTSEEQLSSRVEQLIHKNKKLEKQIAEQSSIRDNEEIKRLINNGIEFNQNKLVVHQVKNTTNLKDFGTRLYDQTKNNTVILLGSISNNKPTIFCAVSLDCVDKINASDLVKDISKIIQGGGGGRPTIATAGGKNPNKLKEALEQGKKLIMDKLK